MQALYHAVPLAMERVDFYANFMAFLRAVRERLHPPGHSDIRTVVAERDLHFQVDLGDRLGCDFYYGYYSERFDADLFMAMLSPGAVVVDVGANFGYYTVRAAQCVGPSGVVHAFEPDPRAGRLLELNLEHNSMTHVRFVRACVGEADGETAFSVMEESAFSGRADTGRARLKDELRVPMRMLDAYLLEVGSPVISAMKIDVEGFEFSVLGGVRETIRCSPELVLLFEVNTKNLTDERREALKSVLLELTAQGLRGWMLGVTPGGLVEAGSPEEIVQLRSCNVFFVRSDSPTEERLLARAADLRTTSVAQVSRHLSFPREVGLAHSIGDVAAVQSGGDYIVGMCARYTERAEAVAEQLRRVEADSVQRLEEIRMRERVIVELQAACERLAKTAPLWERLLRRLQSRLWRKERG